MESLWCCGSLILYCWNTPSVSECFSHRWAYQRKTIQKASSGILSKPFWFLVIKIPRGYVVVELDVFGWTKLGNDVHNALLLFGCEQ